MSMDIGMDIVLSIMRTDSYEEIIIMSMAKKNGKFLLFYESGLVKEEYNYIYGNFDGKCLEYSETGE